MPKIIIILWLLSFSLMNHSSALNKFVWRQTDKAVVKKFLVQHCYDCHDTDIQKGELDLESMNFDMSSRDMLYKWSRVHEMIEHGDMPPKKKNRPAAQEKENVLKALARTLQVAYKQVETLME
ncbi:MAG: hypothetical protein MK132_06500 [Lentisphaerales bacterium]|nr:hypothetical protein [Lentisphaerales bacterium]